MEADIIRTGIARKPVIRDQMEFNFFFSKPGPWGLQLQTILTILRWKNLDHRASAAEHDFILASRRRGNGSDSS